MKDLRKLERVLNNLAAQCHGDEVPDCPILDALSATADRKPISSRHIKQAQIHAKASPRR
jgi:MerR family mercuric resistance operon transcriptional regulator